MLGLVIFLPSPWQVLSVAGVPGSEVKTFPELFPWSGALYFWRSRDFATWLIGRVFEFSMI